MEDLFAVEKPALGLFSSSFSLSVDGRSHDFYQPLCGGVEMSFNMSRYFWSILNFPSPISQPFTISQPSPLHTCHSLWPLSHYMSNRNTVKCLKHLMSSTVKHLVSSSNVQSVCPQFCQIFCIGLAVMTEMQFPLWLPLSTLTPVRLDIAVLRSSGYRTNVRHGSVRTDEPLPRHCHKLSRLDSGPRFFASRAWRNY